MNETPEQIAGRLYMESDLEGIADLVRSNEAWRADSQQLARMVELVKKLTPDFVSAMGSENDNAECALEKLVSEKYDSPCRPKSRS